MENMKEVVQEFDANVARWQREWPQQRQGFAALTQAVKAPGALAHGASKEQVMETGWVAVQMGAGRLWRTCNLYSRRLMISQRRADWG